jgi:hypothetical protein
MKISQIGLDNIGVDEPQNALSSMLLSNKMKTQASEAEARLQKLKQARDESWSALSAALADSRKAFDRANQASWDAFKRAASPNL